MPTQRLRQLALDSGTYWSILALGVAFLTWGVDKLLEGYDQMVAANPANQGNLQAARRRIRTAVMIARFVAGIAFVIFGLIILTVVLPL